LLTLEESEMKMAKTLTAGQKAAETRARNILKRKRVAAAHKAWATIRARKAAKVKV